MAVYFDSISDEQAEPAAPNTVSYAHTGTDSVVYIITEKWDGTGRTITVTDVIRARPKETQPQS